MEAIVKLDAEGRGNLPPSILDALEVATPTELKAHASAGKLELTRVQAAPSPSLVLESGYLVAANEIPFDALTVIEAVRGDRV